MESEHQPARKKRGRTRKKRVEKGMTLQEALQTATPRQLIRALVNRLARVQSIQGKKIPPAVYLQQELRECEASFGNHPVLDEDRI